MAQQRKRKAVEDVGENGDHHTQAARQVVRTGTSPLPVGNGTKSHEIHASIATLAYELYERRGRADGLDVDDWLKAEELIAARTGGVQGV